MKENRDKLYLERIVESIEAIERFTSDMTLNDFSHYEMAFEATLMQFVTIGEMVNRLSDQFVEHHNDLPWQKATGMRNEIAHGYFNIEPESVWRTVKEDLPELKKQLAIIINRTG